MAAGKFNTHETGLNAQVRGDEDFVGSGVYAVLVDNEHSPDQAADVDYEDIAANECQDSDYAPVELTGKTIAVSGTRVRFNFATVDFGSNVTIAARYMYVLYGSHSSPSNSDLILGHVDLNDGGSENVSVENGALTVTPNAAGVFEILRSAAPA